MMMPGLRLPADERAGDALAKLLPKFSERSREVLGQLLRNPNYSGQIPATDTAKLSQNENTTLEKLMVDLLPFAQSYSHAPISNFYVGVVVRGASGALYTGSNIEIPGQCLGFAVHAEQSALSNAYMHSEQALTSLAVGGAPCGHCRQFINEMAPDGEILILTPQNAPRKLSSILPDAFGPAALGMMHGAFPVQTSDLLLHENPSDPLTVAALDAARRAYAPYSKSPSGVALRSVSGRIYRGSYIENVAFNPSLSPLQVAIAAMIAAGEPYSAILGVALVEVPEAKISQKSVSETVLGAIAPNVKLQVFAAAAG
jgi:cytidine deaminase